MIHGQLENKRSAKNSSYLTSQLKTQSKLLDSF
ncbi:uncharacterized protein METZ01_LOCUS246666 [marine metagenome]|uniref:Uncharacterized protein n=1 Tax=marine metagenome TaxID=408172 RepID=A0A382I3B4_9ZZZZ